MTRVAWGKAKLEIFALRKEIISLLDKGNNLNEIFQILNEKNKLTANKSVFYRHATAIRKELSSGSLTSQPPVVHSTPRSSVAPKPQNPSGASDPSDKKTKPKKFEHDSTSSPEKVDDFI